MWKDSDEVYIEYKEWVLTSNNARADVDHIIWWLRAIVIILYSFHQYEE